MGPQYLLLKKGEYGASLVSEYGHFSLPCYPLPTVIDPTDMLSGLRGNQQLCIDMIDRPDDVHRALDYLTGIWMRAYAEFGAMLRVDELGSTGWLPLYQDLRRLFKQLRKTDYAQQDYVKQFTIRIPENLAKLDRIEDIYRDVADTPQILFDTLSAQRQRLLDLQAAKGDYPSPLDLPAGSS